MAFPIGLILPVIEKLLPRLFRDKDKVVDIEAKIEEAKSEISKMQASGELDLLQGQQEVNKEEAKHKSIFVAGWRPAVGWTAVATFVYQFILYPLLTWGWQTAVALGKLPAEVPHPPTIDVTLMSTLVTGMLGIAGMRSYDKQKGTQTDKI